MPDAPVPAAETSPLRRWAPLALLALGAGAGWWFFGDALSFETLRDNREARGAWRDANFALAAGAYMLAYVLVVAFSLPGALIMTLTGGFLFGLVWGALFTLIGATIGATAIFLAAKTSLGESLKAKMVPKTPLRRCLRATRLLPCSMGCLSRITSGSRDASLSMTPTTSTPTTRSTGGFTAPRWRR